jgi:hypothetical protein
VLGSAVTRKPFVPDQAEVHVFIENAEEIAQIIGSRGKTCRVSPARKSLALCLRSVDRFLQWQMWAALLTSLYVQEN